MGDIKVMFGLSYNKLAADCAGAVFYAMMKYALDTPHSSADGLLQNVQAVFTKWKKALTSYLTDIDEQIEVILKFEEMCGESAKEFAPLFTRILHYLYNEDVLEEDAILSWEAELKDADEADKVFVKQAQKLIQKPGPGGPGGGPPSIGPQQLSRRQQQHRQYKLPSPNNNIPK
ncbi:hypothetical protein JHK85_055365 [Glycine max]|nr:hypothetical protein JHK85_055365 [Glycine max]